MSETVADVILQEYEDLIARVGEDATDEQIVAALVRDSAWTDRGAREVLQLARKYGTSILRNAFAIASALQIEDGEAGL
ncbi:MAG: hypothetical protein KF841_00325 [Phycisphaerae bacterium]|nr:hypothetical protein [Phycisphaerae bacterium]